MAMLSLRVDKKLIVKIADLSFVYWILGSSTFRLTAPLTLQWMAKSKIPHRSLSEYKFRILYSLDCLD